MEHLIETPTDASLSDIATTPAYRQQNPPPGEEPIVCMFETPRDWDLTPLPAEVAAHPLLEEAAWVALRDSGRAPLDASPLLTSYQARAEFLVGAWVIDKIVPPRLGGSLLGNLQPQMLREADILVTERRRNAILMPRRSAKTTSLWCVLLGRCWMRPVYMAAYTMLTTAKKANERFKLDVRDPIIRKWRDKKTRPLKINESNGSMGIEWDNGSKLAVLSPNGDDVRSGAYDVLVMDEAGEAEPDVWDDIVGAVVPSFDTRGPGAQLIYAGTGGKYRDGSHFWKTLHADDAGRIRYGVPDDYDPKRLEAWDAGAGADIERLHPGLDGLTNLDIIRGNYPDLGPARFALEYLGHFGTDSGNASLFSSTDWTDSRLPGDPPAGIEPTVLAFAIHLGGAWASIAVGWLVDDDRPLDLVDAANGETRPPLSAVKLIHHQDGNANLARRLLDLWRETQLPIVYDDSPQEKAVIEEVQRLARRARLRVKTDLVRYAEKAVATTKLLNAIEHDAMLHWEQKPLDDAAKIAVPRLSGKARLIGAPDADGDVTPLDAAALVLLRMPDRDKPTTHAPIMG